MISFIDLVQSRKIDLKRLISHRFSIEESLKAYKAIDPTSDENPIGMIITYPDKTSDDKKVFIKEKISKNPVIIE